MNFLKNLNLFKYNDFIESTQKRHGLNQFLLLYVVQLIVSVGLAIYHSETLNIFEILYMVPVLHLFALYIGSESNIYFEAETKISLEISNKLTFLPVFFNLMFSQITTAVILFISFKQPITPFEITLGLVVFALLALYFAKKINDASNNFKTIK